MRVPGGQSPGARILPPQGQPPVSSVRFSQARNELSDTPLASTSYFETQSDSEQPSLLKFAA